jgi:hypothetical protein
LTFLLVASCTASNTKQSKAESRVDCVMRC